MSNPSVTDWFDENWWPTFERASQVGLEPLSHRDQVLALVGAALDAEVGCYLRELIEGREGTRLPELANAFEAIGAESVAKAFRQFLATFPNGAPSLDDSERRRQIDELPREAWRTLQPFKLAFEEWVPDGERVLVCMLHDWYQSQPA